MSGSGGVRGVTDAAPPARVRTLAASFGAGRAADVVRAFLRAVVFVRAAASGPVAARSCGRRLRVVDRVRPCVAGRFRFPIVISFRRVRSQRPGAIALELGLKHDRAASSWHSGQGKVVRSAGAAIPSRSVSTAGRADQLLTSSPTREVPHDPPRGGPRGNVNRQRPTVDLAVEGERPAIDLDALLRRLQLLTVRRLYPELAQRATRRTRRAQLQRLLRPAVAEEVAHRAASSAPSSSPTATA